MKELSGTAAHFHEKWNNYQWSGREISKSSLCFFLSSCPVHVLFISTMVLFISPICERAQYWIVPCFFHVFVNSLSLKICSIRARLGLMLLLGEKLFMDPSFSHKGSDKESARVPAVLWDAGYVRVWCHSCSCCHQTSASAGEAAEP